MKTAIVYWGKGGNVESVADNIYNRLDKNNSDIFDILTINTSDLANYDLIIVGGSTVGAEIWQEAGDTNKWGEFFKKLDSVDLKDKKVALFGLGDQILYPNNFVDGMAIIKEEFEKHGAEMIGAWSTEGYTFTDSLAVKDDMFFGLAIDEDQQYELTDERIDQWLAQLKSEI